MTYVNHNLKIKEMKKLRINIFLASFIVFPVCIWAQTVNDEVTTKELLLRKGDIPDAVSKTVTSDLTKEEPIPWVLISELVNSYGMTSLMPENEEISPDEYYVRVKTTDGSVYDATYNTNGQLIRWREKIMNGHLPSFIQSELAKDEYKDWRVVSDIDYVKEYGNNSSKHYVVKIEKGRKKKNLYFDDKGMLLTEK
jgi:hypothetical protein